MVTLRNDARGEISSVSLDVSIPPDATYCLSLTGLAAERRSCSPVEYVGRICSVQRRMEGRLGRVGGYKGIAGLQWIRRRGRMSCIRLAYNSSSSFQDAHREHIPRTLRHFARDLSRETGLSW